jgi:hypothetical protein
MQHSCEERLFKNVGGYDFISETALVFYDCTLIGNIGEFKLGTHFDSIIVDTEHSLIELQNFNEDGSFRSEDKFELVYAIGDKIEK